MEESETVPILKMHVAPPGSPPRALGFLFGVAPNVPDRETALAAGLRISSGMPAFAAMAKEEAEATLASLAETFSRARFHKLRFDDSLNLVKARRAALGGPVVADWLAIRPVICEAIALLGAMRTAVDIVVYIAARRSGKSESIADRWEANEAITPRTEPGHQQPTRYDVPEVLAIRSWQPWFDDLNLYRNVVYHRGWGEERYGFYLSADVAEEASDPKANAMLLPDADARDYKRGLPAAPSGVRWRPMLRWRASAGWNVFSASSGEEENQVGMEAVGETVTRLLFGTGARFLVSLELA